MERTYRALIAPGVATLIAIWRLDICTRTKGCYERLGASRSLGFRLTREDLGLRANAA